MDREVPGDELNKRKFCTIEFVRTPKRNFLFFLFAVSIFHALILREICHYPPTVPGEGLQVINFAYCLHIVFVIWK